MVAITVYVVIMDPVVQSGFPGKHLRGHGVLYIWRCILCVARSGQLVFPYQVQVRGDFDPRLIRRSPGKLVFERRGPIGQPLQSCLGTGGESCLDTSWHAPISIWQ